MKAEEEILLKLEQILAEIHVLKGELLAVQIQNKVQLTEIENPDYRYEYSG